MELLDKFLAIKRYDTRPIDLSEGQAKECTLIAIQEVIDVLEELYIICPQDFQHYISRRIKKYENQIELLKMNV